VALRVQARVLDRDRGAVGGELEQVGLAVVEVAARERADVHHADHAPLDEQRHAEQGADALLAQDRVEDVRVVDVLDPDRAALGGDPAGEAPPHGDPHALLDLLLDALGRLGHEVAGDLVEQQEGRRVGPEDRGDALQQLAQQVVHRQRGERGVADPLQLAKRVVGRGQ
jgi:hypothetical protein